MFELEYTISPITQLINEGLVKRDGRFDYNVPGHVFVIKTDPRLNSAYYLNSDHNKPFDKDGKWNAHPDHFGIVIGSTDGHKRVLHRLPGFYSSYHPQNDQTTVDPKEYELYKKLIESLASKTVPPHRFGSQNKEPGSKSTEPTLTRISTFVPDLPITPYLQFPQVPATELSSKVGPVKSTFTPTYVQFPQAPVTQTTTKTSKSTMSQIPTLPGSTYVQFSDGQLVPITKPMVPQVFVTFPTQYQVPVTFPSKTTSYSEPDLFYNNFKTSSTKQPVTPEPPTPLNTPITTIHYYTPIDDEEVFANKPTPSFSTKGPQKTTLNEPTISQRPYGVPSKETQNQDEDLFINQTPSFSTKIPQKSTLTQRHGEKNSDKDKDSFITKQTPSFSTKVPQKTTVSNIPQSGTSQDFSSQNTISTKTTRPSFNYESRTTIVSQRDQGTTSSGISLNPSSTLTYREITGTKPTQLGSTKKYPSKKRPTRPTPVSIENQEDTALFLTDLPTKPISTSTKSTSNEIKNEDIVPLNTPTEPMKAVTQVPLKQETESVNEQLPIPDQNLDTTITHVPITEAGTVSISTASTRLKTTRKPITSKKMRKKTLDTTISPKNGQRTTKSRKPTTIVEYSFDSTTGTIKQTESLTEKPSIYQTEPQSTTNKLSTSEHTTFTIPPSTLEYYTFGETPQISTTTFEVPTIGQTDLSTIESTATKFNAAATPEVTQSIKQTTFKSTANDFLLLDSDGKTSNVNVATKNIDFNADDIFGKVPPKATTPTNRKITKKITNNDISDALFGNIRRAKHLSSQTQPPKVIFSNFYVAETEDPTFISNRDVTTDFKPQTDLSYSTSISFEVNKRNANTIDTLHVSPSVKADLSEVINDRNDYHIYKAEMPEENKEKSNHEPHGTKKVFDDLALQLVNHARSIDYLNNKKGKVGRKYKRRNYSAKRRISQRRSSNS